MDLGHAWGATAALATVAEPGHGRYLALFGLEADGDSSWSARHLERVRQGSQPCLEIEVASSEEAEHHTWYLLRCALSCLPRGRRCRAEWSCRRRLMHLRVGLHDPVKDAMGPEAYGRFFGGTPFASHGGFWTSTLARLQDWCRVLARCINEAAVPPAGFAATLRLLGAPADDQAVVAIQRCCTAQVDDDRDSNIFENLARVDQVLYFFEFEFEKHMDFLLDEVELERSRVQYYNCVNAVGFQNEQLAYLVDELLSLRQTLKRCRGGKHEQVRMEHVKLDISDRRDTRRRKEKERLSLAEAIRPLIAEVKMNRFLEKERSRLQDAKEADDPSPTSTRELGDGLLEQAFGGVGLRQKYYSDSELQGLIRDSDK